jgi:hypothetical protein
MMSALDPMSSLSTTTITASCDGDVFPMPSSTPSNDVSAVKSREAPGPTCRFARFASVVLTPRASLEGRFPHSHVDAAAAHRLPSS